MTMQKISIRKKLLYFNGKQRGVCIFSAFMVGTEIIDIKAFAFWPSNSTSKNYCQEDNHGCAQKFSDNHSIVYTRNEKKGEP